MNPLANPEDPDEATETINRYAASDWLKLSYSQHALERMAQRQVPADVVRQVLREGTCVEIRPEIRGQALLHAYSMRWTDQYGQVTVVTAVPGPHKLHVITTIQD